MTHDDDATGLLDTRHKQYAWSFATPPLPDVRTFALALAQYNEDLGIELPLDDFVLFPSPVAIVCFQGITPDGGGYDDMEVVVGAADGPSLSFFSFLYRLHSLIAPYLRDADDVFYEGLTAIAVRDGVPVVALILGS